MKRQSVGIVLCALLLTTFGHELLNRHHLAHSARIGHSQARSPLVSRSNSDGNEQCGWECVPLACSGEDNGSNNLTVSINVTTQLVVVRNITVKIALVIDIKAGLVGIFNPGANTTIIIDIRTGKGVVISGNLSGDASVDLNLTTLTILYKQSGQRFDKSNISVEVSVQIQYTLQVLTSGESISVKDALSVLIKVSLTFLGALNGLWGVIGGINASLRITLRILLIQIIALSKLVAAGKGGRAYLIQHQVTFSLEVILTASSSLQILGYLWSRLLASSANFIEIIGDLLSSNRKIIHILASLGGNSTVGVNGLVTTIEAVVAFVYGEISIQLLISALVRYYSSNSNDETLGEKWRQSVELLLNLIKQLKLTTTLTVVVKLLVDIQQNKWVEKNVNISAIITILIETEESVPLNSIVRIFVAVAEIVAVDIAVGELILFLFQLLAIRGGLLIIFILFSDFDFDESITINGSETVLHLILRQITIPQIVGGNLLKILTGLAVIGQLLRRVDFALRLAGIKLVVSAILIRITLVRQIIQLLITAIRNAGGSGITLPGGGILNIGGSGEWEFSGSVSGSGNGSITTTTEKSVGPGANGTGSTGGSGTTTGGSSWSSSWGWEATGHWGWNRHHEKGAHDEEKHKGKHHHH